MAVRASPGGLTASPQTPAFIAKAGSAGATGSAHPSSALNPFGLAGMLGATAGLPRASAPAGEALPAHAAQGPAPTAPETAPVAPAPAPKDEAPSRSDTAGTQAAPQPETPATSPAREEAPQSMETPSPTEAPASSPSGPTLPNDAQGRPADPTFAPEARKAEAMRPHEQAAFSRPLTGTALSPRYRAAAKGAKDKLEPPGPAQGLLQPFQTTSASPKPPLPVLATPVSQAFASSSPSRSDPDAHAQRVPGEVHAFSGSARAGIRQADAGHAGIAGTRLHARTAGCGRSRTPHGFKIPLPGDAATFRAIGKALGDGPVRARDPAAEPSDTDPVDGEGPSASAGPEESAKAPPDKAETAQPAPAPSEPATSPSPNPAAPRTPDPRLTAARRQATRLGLMLDRLPVGVLVLRGNMPLYANVPFLDLILAADLMEIEEVGGLSAILRTRPGDRGLSAKTPPHALVDLKGRPVPVVAQVAEVDWDGDTATLLTVDPRRDDDSPKRLAALELDAKAKQARLEELNAILDTATDGVIVMGTDGRILSLNRAAQALFGYDPAEVEGEPFTLLWRRKATRPRSTIWMV